MSACLSLRRVIFSAFMLSACFAIIPNVQAQEVSGPVIGSDATQIVPDIAEAAPKLSKIDVIGTERIEPSTVISYMDIRVGEAMTQDKLDATLKGLFGTGLFSDIMLEQKGSTLIVKIVENPIINQVAFEGNKKVKDEQLLSETTLRPRQVFTRTKVQSDVARLYQIYQRQGRFSASIEPKIIKLDQNRVDLVYEIDEGPVTEISTIRFVGNHQFSDENLRDVLATKEARWYRILTANDRYDEDRLSFDQEKLRQFYLENGYADFRVLSSQAEMAPDRKSFFLTMTVEEGDRYKVGAINLTSQIKNIDAQTLKNEVKFSSQDWYNATFVEDSIDAMTNKLQDLQYAFATVRPDVQRNREAKTVDITFSVSETPRVFVERIDIKGNSRTMDKVIRRAMLLVEGDPFSRDKLAKSEQRIRDLGFFEIVEVRSLPGSAPDKSVIDIKIAEKSTGEVSIGAGFSTADGPLADLRLRETNFLGRGQEFVLATTLSGQRTEFDFSFTEPYFLQRDLSAGIDLFHITRDLEDESSYDQQRDGGGLRLGYPLSEHWRQSLRYRVEQNKIENVQSDASRFILDQEGERFTSAVSQRLTYDHRDSTLFPTDGVNAWLETEVAGLGGETKYVSGRVGASSYYPITKKVTFSLTGETGAIGGFSNEDVAINDRYFLGGTNLRGFQLAGIGPRDTSTDDALGGNYFYRGTAEASFPIGLPEELGVTGHAFNDIGSLWGLDDGESDPDVANSSSIRASAGVGISWKSPLGPIRVDLAQPYASEDYDEQELFRFNFGTRF